VKTHGFDSYQFEKELSVGVSFEENVVGKVLVSLGQVLQALHLRQVDAEKYINLSFCKINFLFNYVIEILKNGKCSSSLSYS
jgi:hypothetical protein